MIAFKFCLFSRGGFGGRGRGGASDNVDIEQTNNESANQTNFGGAFGNTDSNQSGGGSFGTFGTGFGAFATGPVNDWDSKPALNDDIENGGGGGGQFGGGFGMFDAGGGERPRGRGRGTLVF